MLSYSSLQSGNLKLGVLFNPYGICSVSNFTYLISRDRPSLLHLSRPAPMNYSNRCVDSDFTRICQNDFARISNCNQTEELSASETVPVHQIISLHAPIGWIL